MQLFTAFPGKNCWVFTVKSPIVTQSKLPAREKNNLAPIFANNVVYAICKQFCGFKIPKFEFKVTVNNVLNVCNIEICVDNISFSLHLFIDKFTVFIDMKRKRYNESVKFTVKSTFPLS